MGAKPGFTQFKNSFHTYILLFESEPTDLTSFDLCSKLALNRHIAYRGVKSSRLVLIRIHNPSKLEFLPNSYLDSNQHNPISHEGSLSPRQGDQWDYFPLPDLLATPQSAGLSSQLISTPQPHSAPNFPTTYNLILSMAHLKAMPPQA